MESTLSTTVIDGISTRYEVAGTGPPLLMLSPGGFNASLDNWRLHGLYRRTDMLQQLQQSFTCIIFDKRESGESGGRVERISWSDYARQAVGLLDHLDCARAFVMGGCVGCSVAAVMAVEHPDRVAKMVLYSPAGGARYRMKQHERFTAHLAYVSANGLGPVLDLASSSAAGFSEDGRVGPWASVLRHDKGFAARYRELDLTWYQATVTGMARLLFDRDTVPGPEPEDLLTLTVPTLVVPGQDTSHAPSAAHFLHECLADSDYWDVPVEQQTRASAPARVAAFLTAT